MRSIRMISCVIAILLVGCASGSNTIKVAIPIFQNTTAESPGPEIYSEMKAYFREETGKRLVVKSITPDELAEFDPALLHLIGSEAVQLQPLERDSIESYVLLGGTVLIEDDRGQGHFVTSMCDQLRPAFPRYEERVSTRSDIVTGRNLPEGSKSNRRVKFRNDLNEKWDRLMLRGFERDGRYPIVMSFEDISDAMQGNNTQGVNGYSIEFAQNLMVNILLDAERAKNNLSD